MNIIRIAARVTNPEICPICHQMMLYDDGRDAYVCDCGFAGPNSISESAVTDVASHIAKSVPPDYVSCRSDISLSVDFENSDVSLTDLSKKLRFEIMAAIKSAVQITSNEMRVKVSEVHVKPLDIKISD